MELRELIPLFQTGFNLVNAAVICAVLESLSDCVNTTITEVVHRLRNAIISKRSELIHNRGPVSALTQHFAFLSSYSTCMQRRGQLGHRFDRLTSEVNVATCLAVACPSRWLVLTRWRGGHHQAFPVALAGLLTL